jgi:RNA polymerase primary sigma factor
MSEDERLRGYLEAVDRLPPLTDREIGDLAETIQRCREIDDLAVRAPAGPSVAEVERVRARSEAARKRLIEGNLRAVVVIADEYCDQGLTLRELLEAGNVGLVRAVNDFDWRRGRDFPSHATAAIHDAITAAISDRGQ